MNNTTALALPFQKLGFRGQQFAERDGVCLLRPVQSYIEHNLPTVTQDKPSYETRPLPVPTGLKANPCVSVVNRIWLAGLDLAKEQGHAISFLTWNPNRRSRVAFDDDRQLEHKIAAFLVAVCQIEIAPRAIEAEIAYDRRPLTPPRICVALDRGRTSGSAHRRGLYPGMVNLRRPLGGLGGGGIACRCNEDNNAEYERAHPSCHSHHSQPPLHLQAPSGSRPRPGQPHRIERARLIPGVRRVMRGGWWADERALFEEFRPFEYSGPPPKRGRTSPRTQPSRCPRATASSSSASCSSAATKPRTGRYVIEVQASHVGPDLGFGTAKVTRRRKGSARRRGRRRSRLGTDTSAPPEISFGGVVVFEGDRAGDFDGDHARRVRLSFRFLDGTKVGVGNWRRRSNVPKDARRTRGSGGSYETP